MAVTKLWKVSVRLGQVLDYTTNPEKTANPEYSAEDYQALKDVLAYAKDEEKTEHEFFCDGINCNVAMARDQFITVKEQFGKTDGIQAYHGYLSFKENEVTPEQAQQIGMEFATKMWGKRFQVVVTTHLNTKHLHCHFVINSVSFADGKRLKDKEKSWYYFRHIADEICLEHKLSIVEKPELHRSPAYLTMKDEAGMPTRYNNAKKAIDEAIAMSRNLRQFQYELGVMGYHSNFSPNRKYATVTPKGSEKPIRTYRLGEEYTKEKILERLIANRDNIVSEAEKDVADREAAANEVPTKSRGEIIVEEAMGKPMQKEGNSHQNPSVAKTDKSPLSERDSETTGTHTDKGVAKAADKKPSVREKLDRYKAAAKAEKEAERTVPEASKEKPKTPEANRQTVHRQPKKSKKSKER